MNKKSIIYRCLVASLCIVSLVVMTYSWFNRPNGASANSMGFDRVMSLNEDMTYIDATTSYFDDKVQDYVELSKDEASNKLSDITTALAPGDKIHFKTIVYNKSDDGHASKDAKVSIRLENSKFPDGISIGTISPLNSETNVQSGTTTSVTIIENVSVPVTPVDSDSGTAIEWYISLSSVATELSNIQLGNLLVYQV